MAIWSFWAPATLMSLIAIGLSVLGLMRGARDNGGGTTDDAPEAPRREMRVYAEQLREIERDLARGVVSADEAERLRTETARRLLDADRNAVAHTAKSGLAAKGVAMAMALAAPALAIAIYFQIGAPSYADMPLAQRFEDARETRESRPSQSELEAEVAAQLAQADRPEPDPQYVALMEQLRAVVAERPDDQRGLRLLAVNEGNMGNFAASAAAWIALIEAQGDQVPVEDLESLSEAMIQAAGGLVSPQTEVILERILRRDPRNGLARYYLGLMFAQTERPDLTFRLWRGLLEDSAPDDPWVPPIRGTIEELAGIAGVRYSLPPLENTGARGPSAEDIANAADMTPEERQEMIGGMVEGLAARLANEGGPPQDWARLINALGMLGQTERARGIWREAQTVFGDRPEALAPIAAVARQLGMSE